MGYGTIINSKQTVITPRNGKNWCDLVNKPKENSNETIDRRINRLITDTDRIIGPHINRGLPTRGRPTGDEEGL